MPLIEMLFSLGDDVWCGAVVGRVVVCFMDGFV